MKKVFLLVLMSCVTFLATGANVTKNVTFTVGYTYTLDPVGDLGLPKTGDPSYRVTGQWSDSNSDYSSGAYDLSPTSDISVIPVFHHTWDYYSTPRGYYTYELTPHVRGNYTFHQKVYLTQIGH